MSRSVASLRPLPLLPPCLECLECLECLDEREEREEDDDDDKTEEEPEIRLEEERDDRPLTLEITDFPPAPPFREREEDATLPSLLPR